MNKIFFKRYSLFALLFTLVTIFWGAWVRLSLSGDGCGKSWPLCNEKLFPENIKSLIEWIHRGTSGLSLVIIFLLFLFAFRVYPQKHFLRIGSTASLILIFIEAFIGAVLVLSGLVGLNQSEIRVFVLAFHSLNSLLLVGTLSFCWRASFWDQFKINKISIYFILIFPFIALTGNIASLAGQLFPAESLTQAMALDLLPSAHISLKVRPLHPLMAVLFLIVLSTLSFSIKNLRILMFVSLFVVFFGFATLISLSPLWMKVGHLILAYSLWIFLVCSSIRKEGKQKAQFF